MAEQELLIHNRYRIVQLIAQGEFGKTFLAVDESQSPQLPCVIKQFLPQNQAPEVLSKAIDFFQKEAQRLNGLGKHLQIPELLGFFEENQNLYLVQEFIDGTNLAKIVEEEGVFKESQIWQVLDNLLPVLKFIHDHQVIHRDIKPQNIIRRSHPYQENGKEGQLVLVDFGAAKLVTAIDPLKIGTSIGSPEYVAPEQAKGKAVFASDLYSLGVTCIYLLTGISPFNLYDIANDCWAWRQYVIGEVSDRLSQILDKLLQNAVSRRFQSADEAIQAINLENLSPNLSPTRREALNSSPFPRREGGWGVRSGSQTSPKNPTLQTENFRTLTRHSGLFASVNAVAISPIPPNPPLAREGDRAMLASGSEDKTIRLWNLETGEAIATLLGHSHFVNSVAFSPDGTILASGSDDRTIKLWDLKTYQEICTLSGHSRPVKSVAFSPIPPTPLDKGGYGGILASGSWDKTIKLWDLNTKKVICTLTGHQLQVTSVAFSPNGQYLASGSFDRTVRVWDVRNLESLQTISLHQTLSDHTWPIFSVAFSPNNQILATGSDDKTIKLWDLNTGQVLLTLSGHSWSVVAVAFSPDGQTLISGSWDKTIKLWRVSTGEEIATLAGHLDAVSAVAISPDGQIVASGSKDKTVKLWRLCDRS